MITNYPQAKSKKNTAIPQQPEHFIISRYTERRLKTDFSNCHPFVRDL